MRRALAISDYLLLAATEMHRQAAQFIDHLLEKYPGKIDVRKTPEFREWQRNQVMDVSNQPKAPVQADANPIVQNPEETPVVADIQEDTIINMFDEIPENIIEDILTEIRNDTELSAIINEFNTAESMHDELNIEIDDRLEEELNNLI